MELYAAARRTRPEHPSWGDLRRFLEEQDVASDALGPISDREAGSLNAAAGLLRKASEVIVTVNAEIPKVFPAEISARFFWPRVGDLRNHVAAVFVVGHAVGERGEFAAICGSAPTRFVYGLASEEDTAYWFLAVRLEGASTWARADSIRTAAVAAGLSSPLWDFPAVPPTVLMARFRATARGDALAATAWFNERLHELEASGALTIALGSASPVP
jgi:hypothetical protein